MWGLALFLAVAAFVFWLAQHKGTISPVLAPKDGELILDTENTETSDGFWLVGGEEGTEPPEDEFGYNGRYTMHVAGEQHGVFRQSTIKKIRLGDKLKLKREPFNEHDANAIAIYWKSSQIGYVSRRCAEWMAPMLDKQVALEASVAEVFFDTYAGERFLNVMMHVDGVPKKQTVNPSIAIIELLDQVDEKRKTWKGQKTWLMQAKKQAVKYIESPWVDGAYKNSLRLIVGYTNAILAEAEANPPIGKRLVISKKIEGGVGSLAHEWVDI